MDAKAMKFGDNEFDCVIDKACFDAQVTGPDFEENTVTYLDEIYRVLAPGGVYFCISYGPPEKRMKFFEQTKDAESEEKRYTWNMLTQKVRKQAIPTGAQIPDDEKDDNKYFHFVYIMVKPPGEDLSPEVTKEDEE